MGAPWRAVCIDVRSGALWDDAARTYRRPDRSIVRLQHHTDFHISSVDSECHIQPQRAVEKSF
jgi:hypothetical protein